MTDTADQGPMFSELMDDDDRQWLSSFGIAPEAAMIEGYLAVIIVIDKEGCRRWQPVVRLTAPTDSVVGLWTLAGHQLTAAALAAQGDQSS